MQSNTVRLWMREWWKSFEKLEMAEGERVLQQDNGPKHTSKRATK
jgi:hypothetical protein